MKHLQRHWVKLLPIMAFCFIVTASYANDQSKLETTKVSIKMNNATLVDIFSALKKQTNANFSYGEFIIKNTNTYTASYQNIPLKTVLTGLSSKAGFGFIITETDVIISNLKTSQTRTVEVQRAITGVVTDDAGVPIPGANVMEAGTNNGVSTGFDGDYQISVSGPNAQLQFSYVGYTTQTITVGNQTNIDITLKPDANELDEVVVVGYGKQQKSDITGAVASVSQKRLELVPNRNIAQVLQGAVPGVAIRQTGAGAVGEQTIIIRGRKSILASNDPLLVVDGVPYYGDLNDINVNDVKSIEVLKDASSAAIYGSRGANGVILVTTKSGNKGKAVISYQGKFGVQNPINLPEFLNPEEFYQFKQERDATLITDTEQYNYENGIGTDWIAMSLRTGSVMQHNLSVTGGTDKVKYYVGGNLMDVKGLSVTDNYKRISGRVNVDVNVTDWLTVGTRSQYTFDDRSGYNMNYEDIFEANPLIGPAYDENGNFVLYPWEDFPDANPLEARNYNDKDYSNQLVANNYVNIAIPFVEGLSYRLNTGIRRRWASRKIYGGANTTLGASNQGYGFLRDNEFKNSVIENIVNYQRTFGKHGVFVTGVYSYEENETYTAELEATNFPNDEFGYYGISQASTLVAENNYQRTALISQMVRLNYAYDSKYLVTLTGRRDGYSGFGPDNKWGLFPSVALGWNISSENFMSKLTYVNLLKLRASWGENGNQAVDPYESITRMREQTTLSGDTSLVGYVPGVIGDPNLGWESSQTVNLGLDFGLLGNRIKGDVNIYQTKTSDLLLNRTISSVHGINEVTQNIGETETKGIELSLGVIPVKTNEFTWQVTGNMATNKNKIVSLYGELDENGNEIDDVANSWFVGQPIRVNYGYKMIGVWQLNEAEEAAAYGVEPGTVKIEDVNGDGAITEDDRRIIGQIDPKLTWGLSNSFTYKNFSLEIFVVGSHGATRLNNLLRDNSASELRRNVLKKNWWTPENPTNEYWANATYAGGMGSAGGRVYEDASYIRLKDISLAYNFPQSVLDKVGFNQIQLFTTIRNVYTITDWTAGDPELDLPDDQAGIMPLQKEFSFGVTLGF